MLRHLFLVHFQFLLFVPYKVKKYILTMLYKFLNIGDLFLSSHASAPSVSPSCETPPARGSPNKNNNVLLLHYPFFIPISISMSSSMSNIISISYSYPYLCLYLNLLFSSSWELTTLLASLPLASCLVLTLFSYRLLALS